jgi:tetratricopeptide (TPR) repeat protein
LVTEEETNAIAEAHAKASWYVSRALQLAPDHPDVGIAAIQVWSQTGELGKALEVSRSLVQRQPALLAAWHAHAQVLERTRQWEDALAAYRKGIELSLANSSTNQLLLQEAQIGVVKTLQHLGRQNEAPLEWLITAIQEWRKTADFEKAMELSTHLVQRLPSLPTAWHTHAQVLEQTRRWEEALAAYRNVLELTQVNISSHQSLRMESQHARVQLLRRLGRQAEAQAEWLGFAKIPERDLKTQRQHIDLTPYYNAEFHQHWHNLTDTGNNLASLTAGLQTISNVVFDARGIVQVASRQLNSERDPNRPDFPESVKGTPVAQHCRLLHFLHSTGWSSSEGTPIGRYVIHYADDQTIEIPIVYGKHVRNWQFAPNTGEPATPEPAWKGPQERWKKVWPAMGVRLYMTTWTNPRPDVEVASIDFVSAMTDSAPVLIAITAE